VALVVSVVVQVKDEDEPNTIVSVVNAETVPPASVDEGDVQGEFLRIGAAVDRLVDDAHRRARDQVSHYTERAGHLDARP
jgi:hypothetical protein